MPRRSPRLVATTPTVDNLPKPAGFGSSISHPGWARLAAAGRPGTVYALQGTITDHRDGVAAEYGLGLGWPEDRNTVHWLENRGTVPAVEISVDVVSAERAGYPIAGPRQAHH